ncbi:protein TPX2-like isoform X3 [Solanum lycopersicum]|uniref:protein TPX2-like isoform X3 n=1 Tax=Solanum lycopersicum TaxID=4081 RepID=UPI0037485CC0
MQREFEERRRLENEEAMMRTFIAQPILIEDPILHPEKVRKPLTKVQEFNVHVDHRAPDRAEFDKLLRILRRNDESKIQRGGRSYKNDGGRYGSETTTENLGHPNK